MKSTKNSSAEIERLQLEMNTADAIVIGAGAGLSTSAGFIYSGDRFQKYFSDFAEKYGFEDMYSGGFYPFSSLEEFWAYWSRYIYINRYLDAPNDTYRMLFDLIKDKNYFVITTNVDHLFQKSGFDKSRLFYTQGDYGLWQCSEPCHNKTYDNEEIVKKMYEQQKDMRVPTELLPCCPVCGKPMSMNLRSDETFVEDEGWHKAAERYHAFIQKFEDQHILFLELGVGMNTPGIIKYPFWNMTYHNSKAIYACMNSGEIVVPTEIRAQSILIQGDIREVLEQLHA